MHQAPDFRSGKASQVIRKGSLRALIPGGLRTTPQAASSPCPASGSQQPSGGFPSPKPVSRCRWPQRGSPHRPVTPVSTGSWVCAQPGLWTGARSPAAPVRGSGTPPMQRTPPPAPASPTPRQALSLATSTHSMGMWPQTTSSGDEGWSDLTLVLPRTAGGPTRRCVGCRPGAGKEGRAGTRAQEEKAE